MRTQISDTA